jgi:MoxR-like ATPase
VPGLGKTLLVKTVSQALDLSFSRVQFTPDLMPADITGTNIVVDDQAGNRSFQFQHGPIFANVVLADEINRATPKTQSALLEAMEEGSVTIGSETHALQQPFFVLATQNPIEMEGTYPLPEAQLDRFLLKVLIPFPDEADLVRVFERTTSSIKTTVSAILSGPEILEHRALVREVILADSLSAHAAALIMATHPENKSAPDAVRRFVRFGASPRGGQAIILGAKVRALMDGRYNVSFEDIRETLLPALRHRIILGFEGEAEGQTTDDVLRAVLDHIKP